MMKIIFCLMLTSNALASVVGISSHPLRNGARVLTAEMTGYMSSRHEMGMGMRYTQELRRGKLLDVVASGAQNSRSLAVGMGLDFEVLSESVSQPRVSFKPFAQHLKTDGVSSSLLGFAPALRKGFSVQGQEFFPYLALPTGMRIDTDTTEFRYVAALSLGASMPFPGADSENVLLSIEGNRDLGASSDYVGALISWVWK